MGDTPGIGILEINDTIAEIEKFLKIKLPAQTRQSIKTETVFKKADQVQIMEAIDFTPPFLQIEKMIILGNGSEREKTKSIGTGVITQQDTDGHYNKTIYLALCGKLMGMAASVHLGLLYPHTAPQVVEVGRIIPTEKDIWRPSDKGSIFVVEAQVMRQKLHLVVMEVKISFGEMIMGTVNDLKLILTEKDSIFSAKDLPNE